MLEADLAAARAEIVRLDQERGQACYDRDSARSVVKAWEREVTDARAEAAQWKSARDECERQFQEKVATIGVMMDEKNAALAEVERLTRELEEMRETMHTQADVAQQRILTLEVETLKLKRLLSPVEEG